MRKQKIQTLHRKHVTPPVAPLFYHSTVDPAGTLRNLEDPTKVLLEREISRVYRLVPFNGSYRDMSITQVSNFIRETGLPDDDPARIRDPGPEPSTARLTLPTKRTERSERTFAATCPISLNWVLFPRKRAKWDSP